MFDVYTGKRGSGKSYDAVLQILKALKQNKKVWVNFKVDFRKNFPNLPHDNCRLFEDLNDLAYMRDGLMVMDEVHWKLSAREWKDLKIDTHQYIAQSRKLHMDLILISQNFKRLDPIARELTETVREHRQIGGRFNEKKNKYKAPWLMWFKQYEPETVDRATRKNKGVKFYLFKKKIAQSYNTDELFGALLKELPDKYFPPSYSADFYPKVVTKQIVSNGINITLKNV